MNPGTEIETLDDLPAADPSRPTIVEGGYILDAETMEVLGHAEEPQVGDDRLRITSPEGVDWVLGLMATEEAKLKGIESRRAALLANLESMEVEPRNRLRWLHLRFADEIESQARRDLEAAGGRGKTAKYPHGQVAFRMTKGSAEILRPEKALAYVEEWAPAKIVPKPVTIEAVRAAIEAEKKIGQEPEVADWFRQAGPRESVAIRTGIGGKD